MLTDDKIRREAKISRWKKIKETLLGSNVSKEELNFLLGQAFMFNNKRLIRLAWEKKILQCEIKLKDINDFQYIFDYEMIDPYEFDKDAGKILIEKYYSKMDKSKLNRSFVTWCELLKKYVYEK